MTSRPALRFAGQAVHRCARTAPIGRRSRSAGIDRAPAVRGSDPRRDTYSGVVCGYPFAARRTLPLCTGVPKWCESEHESDPGDAVNLDLDDATGLARSTPSCDLPVVLGFAIAGTGRFYGESGHLRRQNRQGKKWVSSRGAKQGSPWNRRASSRKEAARQKTIRL